MCHFFIALLLKNHYSGTVNWIFQINLKIFIQMFTNEMSTIYTSEVVRPLGRNGLLVTFRLHLLLCKELYCSNVYTTHLNESVHITISVKTQQFVI